MIKKGFTLVELLAVFVLLAIIFMIAAPNMFRIVRESQAKSFLVSVRQIVKSGNEYRLADLRNKSKKCVYFDFGEDYQIDTLVNNKLYVPIEELTLRGDLPIEGEMEVCRDYVSITVSDGDNTVDIGPDGEEHVFEGNLEESNVSRPVIDNISTSKTTKSITTTVTAHDDKNDIVKYYYYLNGELKQSINNNVYEFTNLKDNTSYKIKIVVENSKGLKTSRTLNIKTDELGTPEITVDKTGWQTRKTVTITYPSVSNIERQYKINSGEITGTDEKEKWITTTSRTKTITYTSEGSVSAKVSDGFNEKIVTYDVIEVDSVTPEVTIEPTIVEGENGWVTMASIKGTITKKGPSQAKLYRCLSTKNSSSVSNCTPTDSEDNIVEDGSSLVLSSSSNYQKVCYQAMSETGMKSSVVCSDSYKVDTESPTITVVKTPKKCQIDSNVENYFKFEWGVSGKGTTSCTPPDSIEIREGKGKIICEAKGKNGKIVSETVALNNTPIGCYTNYIPDKELWDVERDGVRETEVRTLGTFNIYDYNTKSSASGLSKNESITCHSTSYKTKYSGWRIMDVSSTGQITLIHGGTPECYYNEYYQSEASKKILKVKATSSENEGTGKVWTKYGNSELAESIHYMDSDDVNIINYNENGNENYSLWDYLEKKGLGECWNDSGENCGQKTELIDIGGQYFLASANSTDNLYTWYPYVRHWSSSGSVSYGVRPVITLKPNVKLGQESGLKGDEYSLITS